MAKVEIITRAFNRLEYTVQCVRAVDKLAGMDNYRHIVIDQESTDGTGAWLHSLEREGYYKIKPICNRENTGDAGGMADGLAVVEDDCKYIMQLDNDCEPITDDFLKSLVQIMDNYFNIGAIMLKRYGVSRVLQPDSIITINGHSMGILPENKNYTCATIMRWDLVNQSDILFTGDKIAWVQTVTRWMRKQGIDVYKCLDIRVMHIDTTGGQVKKYPSYFQAKTTKGSNFTEVNYNENGYATCPHEMTLGRDRDGNKIYFCHKCKINTNKLG